MNELKNWQPELHPSIFEKSPKTHWHEKIHATLFRLYGNKPPISIYQNKQTFFVQLEILMDEMISLLKTQDNYTLEYEYFLKKTKEKISNGLDALNPLGREEDVYFSHFNHFQPEHYQKIKESLEILVGHYRDIYRVYIRPIQTPPINDPNSLEINSFYISVADCECIFRKGSKTTQQASLINIKEAINNFPKYPTQEQTDTLIQAILQCLSEQGYFNEHKEKWILEGLIDDMGDCDLALLGSFKDAANKIQSSSSLAVIVQSIITEKIKLIAYKHSDRMEGNYSEHGDHSIVQTEMDAQALYPDKQNHKPWAHAHIVNAINRLLSYHLKGIDPNNYGDDMGDQQTAIYFEKLFKNNPDNFDDADAFDILFGDKDRLKNFYTDLNEELSAHAIITSLGGRLRDLMLSAIEKKSVPNYKTIGELISDFGEIPFFSSSHEGVFFYLEETQDNNKIFIRYGGQDYRLKDVAEIEKTLIIVCADNSHILSVKKIPASLLVAEDDTEKSIHISDGMLYILPDSFIPYDMHILYKYKTQGQFRADNYSDQKLNSMLLAFLSSNTWNIQSLFQHPNNGLSVVTIAASFFPETESTLRNEFIPNIPNDTDRQNLIQQLFYGYLMIENWLAISPEWLDSINMASFAEGFTKIYRLEKLIEKIISATLENPDVLLPIARWILEAFLEYYHKNYSTVTPIFLLKPLLAFSAKNKTETNINYLLLELFSKNPTTFNIVEHYFNWKNLRCISLQDTSSLSLLHLSLPSIPSAINLDQINAARNFLPEEIKQKMRLYCPTSIKEMIKIDLAYYENIQSEDNPKTDNNLYPSTRTKDLPHSSTRTEELAIWLPVYLVRLSRIVFEHNRGPAEFFAKKALIPLIYLELSNTMLHRIVEEGLKPDNPPHPRSRVYLAFFLKTITEIIKDADNKNFSQFISFFEKAIETLNSPTPASDNSQATLFGGKKRSFTNTDIQSSASPPEKRSKPASSSSSSSTAVQGIFKPSNNPMAAPSANSPTNSL